MASNSFGFSDVPAEKDLLEVERYLQGLAEFIKRCPTPMTIAVQGDWGTGKTSALKTLQKVLKESKISSRGSKAEYDRYWLIEFNTWQYSQFDLGDQLVFSLIGTILVDIQKRLEGYEKYTSKLKDLLTRVGVALASASVSLARSGTNLVHNGGSEAFDAAIAGFYSERGLQFGPNPSVDLISNLRAYMQEIIAEIREAKPDDAGFKGPDKLIIFIDDLDRLEPKKAIAVMEAIKVFLNVPSCVFVLAIDYDVVLRGVREKYGRDIPESKARAFFDKIIQVPFNLPVGAYNIRELLQTGLKSIGLKIDQEDLSQFEELTIASTGRNPRAIKRLINTFGLVKSVGLDSGTTPKRRTSKGANDQHIFAILCLQTAFPEVFSGLVRSFNTKSLVDVWEDLLYVSAPDSEEGPQGLETRWGIAGHDIEIFQNFMGKIKELFVADGDDGSIDEDLLKDTLAKSAVTAIGGKDAEAMQGAASEWKTEMKPLEERMELLRADGLNHAAKLCEAFDKELEDVLGTAQAGWTPNYMSYMAAGDKVNRECRGKRFLEIRASKRALSILFGKYLDESQRHQLMQSIIKEVPSVQVAELESYAKPIRVNKVATTDDATAVARLIGKAYSLENGE